jgi:transcription initiation factor TFIIB
MQEFELGVQPADPRDFVPKVATAVEVPFAIQRRARELLEELIADNAHVGQSPTGLAAAAVYVAALSGGHTVTQNEVAAAACVGTVTISRQAKIIKSYVD